MAARPHRCARTRAPHPPAPPPPLASTDDALVLVRLALADVARRVVVLPLDARHRGVRAVCVDRVPHDDAVLEVVELTLAADRQAGGPMAALVVGTGRAAPLGWPSDDDWWRWATMVETCEQAGITLLDWLLVARSGALSMAELDSQPESRWCPYRPDRP